MIRRSVVLAGLLTLAVAVPAQVFGQAAAHTAKCKDGTFYDGTSKRGACSKHGGVGEWMAKTATAPAKGTTNQTVKTPAAPPTATAPATKPAPAPKTTAPAPAPKTAAAPAPAPAPAAPAAKAVAPASNAAVDATAECKDGSYSHSKHRSGTCARHGGVKQWLKQLP